MASAKDQVFSTPELLEAILLAVDDMQTLLHSQRVDKTFKATIDSSIHLQRALWFKPTPPDTTQDQNTCQRNPLISKFRKRFGLEELDYGPASFLAHSNYSDEMHRAQVVSLSAIKMGKGSWRQMIPCQAGISPEYWLVYAPCMNGHWKFEGIDQWHVEHSEKDGSNHFGPHHSLGRRSEAPTMGDIIDATTTLAKKLEKKAKEQLMENCHLDWQNTETWWKWDDIEG